MTASPRGLVRSSMPKKDPRIDKYIAGSAAFARPILKHFRKLVHRASPKVTETMKWSFPNFEHEGILCSMASFSKHCAIGFWKWELIFGTAANREAMGHLGKITKLSDLPSDKALLGYIKKAVELNEKGVKSPRTGRAKTTRKVVVPGDLAAALKQNKKAHTTFENFSPSHQRQYIGWITEAKREETRARRLETTVEWLAEGKTLNWRYGG